MSESEPGKKLEPKYGSPFTYFFCFLWGGVFIFYIAFTVVYMYAIVDACRKKTCQAKGIERKKNKTIKNNTW